MTSTLPQVVGVKSLADLPPQTQQDLQADAQFINEQIHRTFEIAREIGKRLELAKARIHKACKAGDVPDMLFMEWCKANFSNSYATLENWRNLVKHLPAMTNVAQQNIALTAGYTLARPNANKDGVERALNLASAGKTITPQMAEVYASEFIHIRDAMETGAIEPATAQRAVVMLKQRDLPYLVKRYCAANKVISTHTIQYVRDAYERHTRNAESITWQNLKEDTDGALNGIGWSVPIADATPDDLRKHAIDMQALHIQQYGESWQWIRHSGVVETRDDGTAIIVLHNPPAEITQQTGRVLLRVRVPV